MTVEWIESMIIIILTLIWYDLSKLLNINYIQDKNK